jgi:zinc and cadmium transporter
MTELSTFAWVAIFAISAAIINTIGILVIHKNEKLAEKLKPYFMCFAAGILISVPLMFALPEAIGKNFYAGFAALIGFLFMFSSNRLIERKTGEKSLAFGITAAEGIGIHSLVDGAIYAVAFSASVVVGLLSGIGLVVHEFAEGVIIYGLLISAGVSRTKAAWFAFFVAALTTPIGAFIAYPLISRLTVSVLGLALGFVAGVLIYILAAHLLPEARGYEKEHSIWAFSAGVALALFIALTKII